MIELKLTSSKGRKIYDIGMSSCAPSLSYLYDKCSEAKQKAFDDCWNECVENDGSAFGVGNANTFSFTASWLVNINGEEAMRVETKDNSYLVWLNRKGREN